MITPETPPTVVVTVSGALDTVGPVETVLSSATPIPPQVMSIVDVRWPHHTDASALHAKHEVERTLAKLLATREQQAMDPLQYVFLSSAMVYGARPDNATPLADDARVAPDDDEQPFAALAETETLLTEFAADHPWFRLAILRPAITVDADVEAWTYPELAGLGSADALYPDRNVQYVALSDVASAIVRVVMDQLSGTFNVSPSDWLTVREAREIAGGIPAVDLPASVSKAVVGPARAFGVIRTAPALEHYLSNSIVVASDGLRRAGWQPQLTSSEALVASVKASWWTDLTPKRRQELALGAVAVGALGGIALAVGVWLRRRAR